jgi:hypothetical protein
MFWSNMPPQGYEDDDEALVGARGDWMQCICSERMEGDTAYADAAPTRLVKGRSHERDGSPSDAGIGKCDRTLG